MHRGSPTAAVSKSAHIEPVAILCGLEVSFHYSPGASLNVAWDLSIGARILGAIEIISFHVRNAALVGGS